MTRPRRARTFTGAWIAVAGVLALVLAGCSATSSDSSNTTTIAAAQGADPVAGRPSPVANPAKKKVKIAIISFAPAVAEVFAATKAGSDRASAVLAADGAQVDYIPVTDLTADGVNQTVRTAILQGYDAIAVTLLGPANCAPMKEAVAKGIKVAAIQGSADCVKDTGALFYHGEDSTTAWEEVGKDMVKALGNKACKVGIITGFFSNPQHEERRLGFIAGLKGSNVTVVSNGVEAGVDPAKYQGAARDYVTANPDLCGILVTTGDNGAVASTLTAAQAKSIKVISSDLTSGTEKQITSGNQYAAVTQDPFGITYDSAIWLYNAVVTGKGPDGGFQQPVKDQVVTADQIAAAIKVQNQGS